MTHPVTITTYPGAAQHQRVIKTLVDYYREDVRILGVMLFGSLVNGTWDEHSDIDLNIVIRDDIALDPLVEWEMLRDNIASETGENTVLVIPDAPDAVDIVFESTLLLSIRYHPLEATSPNIISTLRILSGNLSLDQMRDAAESYHPRPAPHMRQRVDLLLRYAIVGGVAVKRGHIWLGVEILQRMRGQLLEIFTWAYQGRRPTYFFSAQASPDMQSRLGQTLPGFDLYSLRNAFLQMLDILEQDLGELSGNSLALHIADQQLLEQVRQRYLR